MLLPDLSGKPFPAHRAIIPEPAGPCALCRLLTSADGDTTGDGEEGRPVLMQGGFWSVVPNRWPLLPEHPQSCAALIILRRHATLPSELSAEEFGELLQIISEIERSIKPTLPAAFLSFGIQSASTQPHLHAQVVGHPDLPAHRPPPEAWEQAFSAADIRLELPVTPAVEAHVADVSENPGEIRLRSADQSALAKAAVSVFRALDETYAWPFTSLFEQYGRSRTIRILPRIPAAIAYPAVLGVHVRVIDPHELAAALRESLPERRPRLSPGSSI